MSIRILVCGGRDYNDVVEMDRTIRQLMAKRQVSKVIHGGAVGADSLAGYIADLYGIKCTVVNAQWDKYGKAAGAIRNKEMLDLKPDLVVAFPGGTGTNHMVSISEAAGVQVKRIARRGV